MAPSAYRYSETASSLKQSVERVAHRAHADYFQTVIFRQPAQVVLRQHDALEPHSGRLAQAHGGVIGRANLASQPDLAKNDRVFVDRDVAEARSHRRDDSQVNGRLVQGNSPDQIYENVVA